MRYHYKLQATVLRVTHVKICCLYLVLSKEEKYGNNQNSSISRGWHIITMETGWEARGGINSDASSFFTSPPFLKLQFLMGIHNNVADASHRALTSSHVVCMIAIMQYYFVCKSVVFRNHVKYYTTQSTGLIQGWKQLRFAEKNTATRVKLEGTKI